MRTRLPRARHAAAALAALLAAACGSERATGPADVFDPSAVLADVAGQLDRGAAGLSQVGGNPVSGALSIAGPRVAALRNCAFDDGAQAFVCAPFTAGGLTHTYRYAPLDASGAVLRDPTRGTTAALRTAGTTRGTLTGTFGGRTSAIAVDQRHETTVRGLLTTTRTVDGTMTATFDGDAGGAGAGLGAGRFTTTQTTAGLVLPNGARWPSAGTITTVIDGVAGLGQSRTTMTFNGTSVVTLEMTFGDTTERCTLDLAAPPTSTGLRCE